ncbi:unnamed protein product, partial [Ectocarpus fasciculatus]
PLTAVSVGVKWDTAEGKKIDLDLSCIMLTRECAVLDSVHYQQLKSADGSIVHGGDTRVDKEGDADDEQIHINLKDVPSNATFLCFYLTSYTGNPLEDVETCCARLIDSESLRSLALLDCDDADLKIHSALLLCILIRVWVVKALGHCFNNQMEYGYLLPEMKGLLTDMIPGCESGPRDFTAYLTRDELVDISTLSTDPLNRVSVGVKWDTAAGKRIDLDLGCIMLSSDCGFLDYVSYQKLRGSDNSVVHGGDTRGDRVGDVDDEQVHIALDTVPADVAFIGFYLTSYHGNLLADVNSCCARLLQMPSQRDLILLDCDNIEIKQHSSVLIGILVHVGNKWFFLNASDCSIGTALPENVEHLE